jgi:hypothetical protein
MDGSILMGILIFSVRSMIILSYLLIGLYLVDMVETRFEYMDDNDVFACVIGTIFIGFSLWLLAIFSQINK